MKKNVIKLAKALSLDKEIITRLNDEQLGSLEGGMTRTTVTPTTTCNAKLVDGGESDYPTIATCNACSCND